ERAADLHLEADAAFAEEVDAPRRAEARLAREGDGLVAQRDRDAVLELALAAEPEPPRRDGARHELQHRRDLRPSGAASANKFVTMLEKPGVSCSVWGSGRRAMNADGRSAAESVTRTRVSSAGGA